MKKILFILHLPPPVHGSSVVGRYIQESRLVNEAFDTRYVNLGTSRSVNEIGKNPLGKIGRYLLICWQVFVQMVRFHPDLCYLAITAKGPAFYKDTVVALMAKLFRAKLVYHFHNKGVSTCQHQPVHHFFYQLVFRNTDAILLSSHLYFDVKKYFSEDRVHYCPNGILDSEQAACSQKAGGTPAVRIAGVPPAQVSLSQEPVEILFLSNLIESKGVLVLLDACKRLHEKQVLFHCTFVGGDSDLTVGQCQHQVQDLGLTDVVHFVGKKYGEEKAAAFSQADVFAFPTYYSNECFPLVLLEALQYGLPAVSTLEGGIPDMIEDGVNGFLVPQRDPEALADKLEQLICDSDLRHRFGEAGRRHYEQKFTLEHFESRLAEILTKLVAED